MGASIRHVDSVQLESSSLSHQLQQARATSDLLAAVGKELASSLELVELLDRVAHAVVPRFADGCVVDVVAENHRQLVAAAHVDPLKEELARELRRRFNPLSAKSSPMRRVMDSGQPRYIAAYTIEMASADAVDPEDLERLARLGTKSVISVPLAGRRGPMGVMSFLHSDSGRSFNPEDVGLACEVASLATWGIDNALLFADEQRARREAERLQELSQKLGQSLASDVVLDQIAATAAELLDSPVAGVFLLDAAGESFELVAGRGLDLGAGLRLDRGMSLAGGVIASGAAVTVSDARVAPVTALPQLVSGEAVGSLVVAPIISRSGPLGVVEVYSTNVGAFNQHDADLLSALSGPAAAVLENARLYRGRELDLARLYTIVEQLPVGIVVAEAPSRQISLKNRLADRLAGTSLDSLRPGVSDPRQGLHSDGRPYALEEWPLSRALTSGEVVSNERIEIKRPDGGSSYLSVNAAPIRDANGRVAGAVAVFDDVSGEEELRREKEHFLAAAAHDLKTPLTSIRGLTQLLHRQLTRMELPQSERISATLEGISSGTRKMTSLIDELLDIFRLQSMAELALNRTETDLIALARNVIEMHTNVAPMHRIELEASAPTLTGYWDEARLERALSNVLGNAIKYSPESSEIRVQLSSVSIDGGEHATVSISDRGIGIPAEELEQIFERFQRGSNVPESLSGSGIGLSYVRQIVVQHGGSLDVESELGKGTTLTLRLPRQRGHG